jgi:hypothetical protein
MHLEEATLMSVEKARQLIKKLPLGVGHGMTPRADTIMHGEGNDDVIVTVSQTETGVVEVSYRGRWPLQSAAAHEPDEERHPSENELSSQPPRARRRS